MKRIITIAMAALLAMALCLPALAQQYQDAKVDRVTGETAVTALGAVTSGKQFVAGYTNSSILAAGYQNCSFTPSTSKATYLTRFMVGVNSTTVPVSVVVYELVNKNSSTLTNPYSKSGNMTAYNLNRDSTTAATSYPRYHLGGGIRGAQNTTLTAMIVPPGGVAELPVPLVLKKNRVYVFKVTNSHPSQAGKFQFNFSWQER